MIRLISMILLIVSLLISPAYSKIRHHATTTSAAANTVQQFDSETAAQFHCPSDTVVWLNTSSGIYHEKGMRWYGRTKQGAYVCRKEADGAGDRDTRNGQ